MDRCLFKCGAGILSVRVIRRSLSCIISAAPSAGTPANTKAGMYPGRDRRPMNPHAIFTVDGVNRVLWDFSEKPIVIIEFE